MFHLWLWMQQTFCISSAKLETKLIMCAFSANWPTVLSNKIDTQDTQCNSLNIKLKLSYYFFIRQKPVLKNEAIQVRAFNKYMLVSLLITNFNFVTILVSLLSVKKFLLFKMISAYIKTYSKFSMERNQVKVA